jgi:hypothetical protein
MNRSAELAASDYRYIPVLIIIMYIPVLYIVYHHGGIMPPGMVPVVDPKRLTDVRSATSADLL